MQPIRHFRLPARFWPLGLVVSCGFLLSYLFVRTYVSPLPRQYQLDFTPAKWIQPATFSPTAYFRTKIFLSVPPEQAWLEVAATDSFKLSVNGRPVGVASSLKTRVSGIYDIKTRLVVGTNVIAVEVDRISYPASAQLIVRGIVKEPGHEARPILSDEGWKVTPNTGIVSGFVPWNSPLVGDETWPGSRAVAGEEVTLKTDWVLTNPLLLQLPRSGKWLLARDAPREAIFSTSLRANRSNQETWIQVASSGELDLVVNGRLITSVPTAPLKAKPLPHLNPATVITSKPAEQQPSSDVSTANVTAIEPLSLEAYDISPWIVRGDNSIVAAVRSSQNPAMFIAEGFTVLKNGNIQQLQTDSTWQVLRVNSRGQSAEIEHSIEAGDNGSAPWGYLREGVVKQPKLTDFDTVAKSCAIALATLLASIGAWLLASWSASVLTNRPMRITLARDALLHVPVVLGILTLLLLSYDYRFPNDLPFRPFFCLLAVLSLITVRVLHSLALYSAKSNFVRIRLRSIPFRNALPYFILAAIMALGFALRYHDLAFVSFDHDEMGMIQKSKGVFVRGYPYNEYSGIIRPATTYELLGYVLAVAGRILGYSEWSMRLPSCIWGTLTIGAVGLMGRRLFSWRVGLFAAFIYACLTLNIRWAQNAFYVQQCQFLSMLTFWFFYEAIRVKPIHRGYLTAASVLFCLAFLSWEGTGFILPAFVVALLVVRPGDWSWLKGWHLYKCLFFVGALVIAQFCWRTILGTAPYLTIGSGLSNLTGPSLFFLNYHYEPSFYIEKLLLSENHVPFTIIAALGIFFCWRYAAYRYLITVVITLLFLYTNFLAALSPRYCYFYQPLLLLAAVAAAVALYDHFLALARLEGNSVISRGFAHASGLAMLALLFIQSNEWLVKAYYLSGEGDSPGLMTRMDTYKYDYRAAALYVRDHVQPGDVIIPTVPHVFEYYSGIKGNFFLDTLLSKKVSYNGELAEPAFVDKFRGYPTIRSLTELREATHRGRRTWIVFVPYGALKKLGSPEVLDYLAKNAKSVYESYRAKVLLIEGASEPEALAQSKPSS